ncbi:HK97 family phage prohead protease [Oryzibacter oryziterrae]|uniref:HK97 family phage prohead protease n=1 Tax=Oryzibacter oryziterrae TaxID=2766474 RepID=UPI001F02C87C|nr:HK97 family phage prohead protease [Oryzibacter oryziterrae]
MTQHERRAALLEIRAKGRKIEGYAATFGTETRIGARFTEVIAPGAFSASLKTNGDILALVDHDPARVLARTRSGTLRLSEDTRGLAFSLDLPDTTAGRDVLALAERGDLGGMSFGFAVRDGGEHWQGDHRELRAVDLFEVSIVSAFPAYPDTTIAARSRVANAPRLSLTRRYIDLMEAGR